QAPERGREPAQLTVEVAVGEGARVSRLALPDQRGLVVKLAVAMAVEAALDDVHAPATPPGRPRFAPGEVDDLVVVAVERDVDVFDRRVPEPLDVGVRTLQQLRVRSDVVAVHEALEPAPRDDVGAR